MNDPTPAERETLGARLTAAIPTEPELTGLAGRVEHGARRHRRVRRAGVAAVAAVAVAAVIAVPQWLGSQPRHEGSPPTPSSTHVPTHPCSGRPDHRDFTHGTAAWVTFCFTKPSGGDTEVAHYPRGVLVTGAASLVGSWQDGVSTVHSCPYLLGATPFTVRVGFSDGTTSELGGDTGYCQVGVQPSTTPTAGPGGQFVYDGLMTALGRQQASAYHRYNPPGPPPSCPASPRQAGRLNHDGYSSTAARASNLSGVLLALPAVESLVCRYDASGRLDAEHFDQVPPEPLRLASGSSFTPKPIGAAFRGRGSAVVALRDRTGTWRTFTITGRDHLVTYYQTAGGQPEPVGYAGENLMGRVGLANLTQ